MYLIAKEDVDTLRHNAAVFTFLALFDERVPQDESRTALIEIFDAAGRDLARIVETAQYVVDDKRT